MRELEKKGILNGDMIDSIMTEEKMAVSQVIINGAELETYFGEDKTSTQMKEKILELLDKKLKPQEREAVKTEKKTEQPEKYPTSGQLGPMLPCPSL